MTSPAVVDEPQPQVVCSWGLAPKPVLTCVFWLSGVLIASRHIRRSCALIVPLAPSLHHHDRRTVAAVQGRFGCLRSHVIAYVGPDCCTSLLCRIDADRARPEGELPRGDSAAPGADHPGNRPDAERDPSDPDPSRASSAADAAAAAAVRRRITSRTPAVSRLASPTPAVSLRNPSLLGFPTTAAPTWSGSITGQPEP